MVPENKTLDPAAAAFFERSLDILDASGIPFLVCGAYALDHYTGVERHTNDFDVVVRAADCPRALERFAAESYRAELTFPHWLGKVYLGEFYLDLIFSSGNGIVRVDDDWFRFSDGGNVFGRPVRITPIEEMIWSKAYIMERERFDGADVAHLIRARRGQLDWPRLRRRFGPHWHLLLAHLILFRFIYPHERMFIPQDILESLFQEAREEAGDAAPAERMCRGTLLSREQYLTDLRLWGYADARMPPNGPMSPEDILQWTDAIGNDTPDPPKTAIRFYSNRKNAL